MLLYRLVHYSEAYKLQEKPIENCLFHNNLPYFTAFDSVAAAIIESHIFRIFHSLPSSMRIVEFTVADTALVKKYTGEPIITYKGEIVLPQLSETAQLCLAGEVAAISSFPSLHYKNLQNFLVNPTHPHFSKIRISRIYPCA